MEQEEAHHIGPGRWRVPAGSIVIDAAMVIALIWTVASMQTAVETLDRRLTAIELREITPGADRRISILENQMMQNVADHSEIKGALRRIEDAVMEEHIANGRAKR